MKNAFNGFISRSDIAEERISELGDISIESSKTEKQKEQSLKNHRKYPRTKGQLQKVLYMCNALSILFLLA